MSSILKIKVLKKFIHNLINNDNHKINVDISLHFNNIIDKK